MRSTRSVHARRRRWATLGAEAVLIVFSVLLALALDEWRQGIADRRLAGRVRETIHAELTRNRAQIKGRLPYHERMLQATNGFLEQNMASEGDRPILKRNPRNEDLGIAKGMGTAGRLGRTGWDLALNSGALEQMDYDTTVALSNAYAIQQEVEELEIYLVEQLFQLYQAHFRGGSVGGELVTFRGVLTDFVLRQRELLSIYDYALAQAGK